MDQNLKQQKCVPCKGDEPTATEEEIKKYQKEVPDWDIITVDGVKRLQREFEFSNFAEAHKFTNHVGEVAEEQGHHPLLKTTWGKVTVDWWTHKIGGLHKNDFIMASKTDEIYQNKFN